MADIPLPDGVTVTQVPGPRWWGRGPRWQIDGPGPGRIGGYHSEAEAVAFAWHTATQHTPPVVIDEAVRLNLAPGDTVVLRAERHLSDDEFDALARQFRTAIPDLRIRALILDGGLHLEAVLAGVAEPDAEPADADAPGREVPG